MDNNNKHFFSPETISEIMGDLFFFEIILEIKRRMKKEEAKSYVVNFLKILAPIYIHEFSNASNKLGLIPKDILLTPEDKKRINHERQLSTHKVITSSLNAQEAIAEMGIDFSEKRYDINIVSNNGELFDLNFESQIAPLNDIDFWNFLFSIPKIMLSSFISSYAPNFSFSELYSSHDTELNSLAYHLDETLSLSRYSYSAQKLFQNADSLEDADKIFILYRYRMITSLNIIATNLPGIRATISPGIELDIEFFFRKYRALLICILGDELRSLNTQFGQNIRSDIQNSITDSNFFPLNRKLRNNLHYVTTEILSQEDLEIITQNQSLYIGIFEKHIKSSINIDIDKECLQMTGFTQAFRASGLSCDELNRYYYFYYIKYLFTGKL